jgi:RNA polymerase sigma factor (sigma-70 family)
MQDTATYMGSQAGVEAYILDQPTRDLQDVISRYLPAFHRYAYRCLGNAADAEDAVQDALLAAYKHLGKFEGRSQMATWVTAIVNNSARMRLRKRSRRIELSIDERVADEQELCLADLLADNRPSPEDECRHSELQERFMQSVAQLSPSLREAFTLRALQGLPTSEIAQSLGVTEGTVKSKISRARANLRRLMGAALNGKRRSDTTSSALQPLKSKTAESILAV